MLIIMNIHGLGKVPNISIPLSAKYGRIYKPTPGKFTKSASNTLEYIWKTFPWSIEYSNNHSQSEGEEKPLPPRKLGAHERVMFTLLGDRELNIETSVVEVEV